MYDEFPTIYETSLELKWIYFIILGVIGLILLVISLISLAKIFKKANRSGVSAFIPFYNLIILLEITNSSKIYFLFFLIPGVNLIFHMITMFSLARLFRKSKAFAFGLTFLPFIFYPILGFSDSEYIGINLVAIEGKSVTVDIPKIVDNEEQQGPVVHEEKDTSLENINISIGGGVYQKDYTNTLLQVDEKQTVSNESNFITQHNTIPKRVLNDNIDSSKLSFIAPIEEEIETPKEEINESYIQFPDPINFVQTNNMNSATNVEKNNSITTDTPMEVNQKDYGISQKDSISLEEPSFVINPQVQSLTDHQLREKLEFISCPKCGAKMKSDAKVCFLCGKKMD